MVDDTPMSVASMRMTLELRHLQTASRKIEDRRRKAQEGPGFDRILRTANSPLNRTIAPARQFASFEVPVPITGEPGHRQDRPRPGHAYGSLRGGRPFDVLNCAGMSDEGRAAELFHAPAMTEPRLPPLRMRGEDIGLIAGRMLHDAAELHGKPVRA